MRSKFLLAAAVFLFVGTMASFPVLAEKRSHRGGEARGYYLEPQGWVRIGIDYDDDGYMDRFEYISVYELERARQRSGESQSPQRMRQREVQRGYYPGKGPQAGGPMRTVSGTIQGMKKISPVGMAQQHQIAKVRTPEGRIARVDLGPAEDLKRLNLQDGDQITVHGHRGTINERGVLLAERVEASGRTVTVNRPFERDLNRYSGKVLSTRTASFRMEDVPDQVFARVRLDEGGTTVVNLGPKDQLSNVDLKGLKGKEISFLAHRATIGNRAALVAEQFRVDGRTVRIDWTGETASAPSGRMGDRTS